MGVVYEIRNTINNKRYIGSTVNHKQRKHDHFKSLRSGRHHSIILQRSFHKYGEDAFFFAIIEDNIPPELLVEREQYWLDKLQPEYNIAKVAYSCLGVKWSEESRAKMRGRLVSDKTRAKLSAARMGCTASEETKTRLKRAHETRWKDFVPPTNDNWYN